MAHIHSFVRIPLLALRQAIRPLPPLAPFAPDVVRMRVYPNDIDFNFHLNNSRYLSIMDYGRMRLTARVGMLSHIIRRRHTPLVGGVWITYRRSLGLFAGFDLSTRLLGWDDRWFYFEQTLTGSQGLAAIAQVRGTLANSSGIVPPQSLVDLAHPGLTSPPLPAALLTLNELTKQKLDAEKAQSRAPHPGPSGAAQ